MGLFKDVPHFGYRIWELLKAFDGKQQSKWIQAPSALTVPETLFRFLDFEQSRRKEEHISPKMSLLGRLGLWWTQAACGSHHWGLNWWKVGRLCLQEQGQES